MEQFNSWSEGTHPIAWTSGFCFHSTVPKNKLWWTSPLLAKWHLPGCLDISEFLLPQMLLEPVNICILRTLQAVLLRRIIHIAPSGKSMHQPWKILIIILDIESGYNLVAVLFQLRTEHWICFWSANLHRHRDLVNFCLFETRRMRSGDTVDQIFT